MSRRKVPTCMTDVKKSRGALVGAVKKALGKIQLIKHDEVAAVAAIKPRDIERLIDSVNRTETNFLDTLDEAQEYLPEGEEAEDNFHAAEEADQEKFEQTLYEFKELAECILALKTSQLGLADLTLDIASLEQSLTDRPDDDHSRRLESIFAAFDSLRQDWRKARLPSDHALKKELDACTTVVDTLAANTARAKLRSTPGATLSSSSRVDRDRTKLPTISIPTFDGDILAWPTFWQKFSATVHVHNDLPESTKLAYLRTAITDPEAAILLNPAIDGPETYERLVKELHQRYARTRKIHRGLVNKLSTLPPAKYQSKELRKLLDSATSYVDCLKTTKQFSLDEVITSMIYNKLPYKMQVDWDDDHDDEKVAPYTELFEYLSKKILTLSDNQTSTPDDKPPVKQEKKPERKQQPARQRSQVYTVAPAPQQQHRWECHFCQPEKHPLYVCPKWSAFNVTQKLAHVKAKNLCINCLGVGHLAEECKSTYRCRHCSQAHHTSVHQENQPSQQVTSTLSSSSQLPDALPQTAEVLLKGPGGEVKARALLDSAASVSLITSQITEILNLPIHPSETILTTLKDSTVLKSEHLTEVTLSPVHHPRNIRCRPAVLDSVISNTPIRPFDPVEKFPHLQGLRLADPTYHIPGHVDILLGADMWLKLQGNHPPVVDDDSTIGAVDTIFGWVITGTAPDPDQPLRGKTCHLQPTISNKELSQVEYNFELSKKTEEFNIPLMLAKPQNQSDGSDSICRPTSLLPSQEPGIQQTDSKEEVIYSLKESTSSLSSSAKDEDALAKPIDSKSVSRNDVLEQQTAALQPPILMTSTRRILGEAIPPQTLSTECQTPQQISLPPAATRSQIPASNSTHHFSSEVTLPQISSTECKEPQRVRGQSGEIASTILQSTQPKLHQIPSPLEKLDTVKLTKLCFDQQPHPILNLPSTNPAAECQTPQQNLLLLAAPTTQLDLAAECQTPQQNLLPLAASFPQPNPTAECQTPQQILLSSASPPTRRVTHPGNPSVKLRFSKPPPAVAKTDCKQQTNILNDMSSEVDISTIPQEHSSTRPVQSTKIEKDIGTPVTRKLLIFLLTFLHFMQQTFTNYFSIKREGHRLPSHCKRLWPTAPFPAALLLNFILQVYPSQRHRPSFDATNYVTYKWYRHQHLTPSQSISTETDPNLLQLSARRLSRSTYVYQYWKKLLYLIDETFIKHDILSFYSRINLTGLWKRFGHPHFFISDIVRFYNWNDSSYATRRRPHQDDYHQTTHTVASPAREDVWSKSLSQPGTAGHSPAERKDARSSFLLKCSLPMAPPGGH